MSSNTNAAPTDPIQLGNPDEFDTVVDSYDVVLVDFYADWCGPCQMMEPAIEAIAEETATVVAKVDVDEHQGLARQYNVQGVPTLYLFADGERAERLVGMQDEGTLFEIVDGHL